MDDSARVAQIDKGRQLVLVRHPETKSNRKFNGVNAADVTATANDAFAELKILDTELTDLGVEQMERVVQYLVHVLETLRNAGRDIQVTVMSSPLQRAAIVAEEFARRIGAEVVYGPFVEPIELKRYGAEQIAAVPGLKAHANFDDYVEESLYASRSIWEDVFAKSTAETHFIIVFTHSLFMNYMVPVLNDGTIHEKAKYHHPNICMSQFGYDGPEWHTLFLASTGHIPAEMITGGHGLNMIK